jgi:tetratricopeptide (TPR) repeat protein
LKSDRQSKQYPPAIFATLIRGCLSCWNLELGQEISQFASTIPSATISIPSAQLQLESGHPSLSREIANRGLRFSNLSTNERLQLELIVCSSYAEEGKHAKAINLSKKLDVLIKKEEMPTKSRADLLQQMARIQYFLGRYQHAAELFEFTSDLYLELADWESAAKALFNTAACYHNCGGTERTKKGFVFVERARKVAETHGLSGPLSHCETFYGLDAYQHGNFAEAREYFRRGLETLPASDKSFRRLQILSMQTLTHLATGAYHNARKSGQQTLSLAKEDDSERIKSRYTNLEAQLVWEDGNPQAGHELLKQATESFSSKGIHTLEEISTYSRYLLQCAWFFEKQEPVKPKICDSLKKNVFNWQDFLYSKAQFLLNSGEIESAQSIFEDMLRRSQRHQNRYHDALGHLGLIKCSLLSNPDSIILDNEITEFEVAVARIGSTPLKAVVHIVNAARSYHRNDFPNCVRSLKAASKQTPISFLDKFIVNCWISTIEGHSSRLTCSWQVGAVARATRIYFSPSLVPLDHHLFKVGKHYSVDLKRHTAIAELLHHLIAKPDHQTTSQDLQTEVWKQSIKTQGWRQKIRNTIMRLRHFFPYTIAPIILHQDQIALFTDAIHIQRKMVGTNDRNSEIFEILTDAPLTSLQLSRKLQISSATAKRTLKKMADDDLISTVRCGRNIYYTTNTNNGHNSTIFNT